MNYNNLSQRSNFIAGSNAFKNIPFFLTTLNVPGINLGSPDTGARYGAALKLSGDTIQYNTLAFEMLIDEDFQIYQELMGLLNNNISIESGTFGNFQFDFYIELNNSKGHKVLKLNFSGCRLLSIGDIQLDTTDEQTEHTITMELAYDFYELESTKRYNLITTAVNQINPGATALKYSESFSTISTDWQPWGVTNPIIVTDLEATNETALDTNGTTTESGVVLNAVAIPVINPFEFIFRVKQPLGADLNANYYVDFGVTEGLGIASTTNGRTGSTVMGVLVDGGNKDSGVGTKETIYTIKNTSDTVSADFDNDGTYHEYKFVYSVSGANATYEIYKDNTLEMTFTDLISTHDFFYLYIQGKSVDGDQYVDLISGKYGVA